MITSWKEMPIGVLKQISEIDYSKENETEKTFKRAALLSGMDYNDFLNLSLEEANAIVNSTVFLFQEPKAVKVKRIYHLGEHDYRLMKNADGMTTAQYLNYQALMGVHPQESMIDLMAIALVPDGKKYGDYDMDDVREEIANHLNVEEALGIANFFIRSFERSIRRIALFSEASLTAMKWTLKGKDKEEVKAKKIVLNMAIKELRSMYGYRM